MKIIINFITPSMINLRSSCYFWYALKFFNSDWLNSIIYFWLLALCSPILIRVQSIMDTRNIISVISGSSGYIWMKSKIIKRSPHILLKLQVFLFSFEEQLLVEREFHILISVFIFREVLALYHRSQSPLRSLLLALLCNLRMKRSLFLILFFSDSFHHWKLVLLILCSFKQKILCFLGLVCSMGK